MSAAANAAGYLYAHGLQAMSDRKAQGDAAPSHRTAESQPRTPTIVYRKRRLYVPAAMAASSATG
jgi:hypothetical protein